jgi:hypothetical protein
MIKNSIVSYPERGSYGNSKFHGNFTGYLVKDLIEQFGAKSVLDPMSGSGTTADVCEEMGVRYTCTDLSDGQDIMEFETSDRFDMIILHLPYWNMVQYSDDPRDLSNAKTLSEFLERTSNAMLRMARFLTPQGRVIVVIGNLKRNGKYYPLGACLEVLFMEQLKYELIKVQHNVRSSSYGNKMFGHPFIPTVHEKVLIFAGFKSMKWEELLLKTVKELGGKAKLQDIYQKLAAHPKTADNPTWMNTIRRTAQESLVSPERGVWEIAPTVRVR